MNELKPYCWQVPQIGKRSKNRIEMSGSYKSRTGLLTIIGLVGHYNGNTRWAVECERGHHTIVYGRLLRNGKAVCKECVGE